MLIINVLIQEHSTIKKMIIFLNKWVNANDFSQKNKIIDFFKIYADKCHHGKEEKILFNALKNKRLCKKDRLIFNELLQEHKFARKLIRKLTLCKKFDDSIIIVDELMALYIMHIDKENNHFFLPCLTYLDEREKSQILKKFEIADKKMKKEKIKYEKMVDKLIKDHLENL